jgi:inosine-uridine nucleoside N-ribohydrolase
MSRTLAVIVCFLGFSLASARSPVLIDTDIGDDIDDALALALALSSPELDVRGITTVHGDTHTRAGLLCRFLHLTGKGDIPVAAGSKPFKQPDIKGQMQYALRPGFRKQPVKESAVEFLHAQLRADRGNITILALGPLTNVAALLRDHPESKPWIKRIVLMGGALRVGYTGQPPVEPEWNIKTDIEAARTVFTSGIPLLVAPLDATVSLTLEGRRRDDVFRLGTPLNNQLAALFQLWDRPTPTLFDPLPVAVCVKETLCKMEEMRLEVDDKGITKIIQGKPNARVVTSVADHDKFLDWFVERLAPAKAEKPIPLKVTNPSKPVERGNFPNRVHAIEDFKTDIERRWWLCGKLDDNRACRGVLTNDFDEKMGDANAIYTAVIFNPVPGPPMGKNTRLGFRARLKGTDRLRVQIYSLTNGYHRCLTLTELPQERWLPLTVDMTQCRRADGSGPPLGENERIDDIQFYTDPGVELLIEDIVLYDAATADEKRPFPERPLFCGWFDTGRQGQEWPGVFEIVPHKPPLTWKAASSVAGGPDGKPWILLELRGARPLGKQGHVRFRYRLEGADTMLVSLVHDGKQVARTLKDLKKGEWAETTVDFELPEKLREASEIHFVLPKGALLLIDDVLLY